MADEWDYMDQDSHYGRVRNTFSEGWEDVPQKFLDSKGIMTIFLTFKGALATLLVLLLFRSTDRVGSRESPTTLQSAWPDRNILAKNAATPSSRIWHNGDWQREHSNLLPQVFGIFGGTLAIGEKRHGNCHYHLHVMRIQSFICWSTYCEFEFMFIPWISLVCAK